VSAIYTVEGDKILTPARYLTILHNLTTGSALFGDAIDKSHSECYQFFHNLGRIIYEPEANSLIHDPMTLINFIIPLVDLQRRNIEVLNRLKIANPDLEDLMKKGIIPVKLLSDLWNDSTNYKTILQLFTKLSFCAQLEVAKDRLLLMTNAELSLFEEGCIVVPSILPSTPTPEALPDSSVIARFWMPFIPFGVFQTLLVHLMRGMNLSSLAMSRHAIRVNDRSPNYRIRVEEDVKTLSTILFSSNLLNGHLKCTTT